MDADVERVYVAFRPERLELPRSGVHLEGSAGPIPFAFPTRAQRRPVVRSR